MTIALRGLTWDHPRATTALYAATAAFKDTRADVTVTWDVQPLSGFEHRLVSDAAKGYDLVIFDHPHVGEIAQQGLFLPVDDLAPAMPFPEASFVGPTLQSYRYDGCLWGLPLDAACQVSCTRPDLVAGLGAPAPTDWDGVLALGERAKRKSLHLAMAFAGVHSLMTLLSLCANQGAPLARDSATDFLDRDVAEGSLTAMRELLTFCAPESVDWNSIDVQDAMSTRDDLVFCPVVYGFSPYSRRERPRRLVHGNLPGLAPGSGGSTLGGAGIGISARSTQPQAAFDVVRFLTSATVQEDIIGLNDGQPARANAWNSAMVNHATSEFYAQTRQTLERAWIRPRFAGYLRFQRAGGAIIEAFLRDHTSKHAAFDALLAVWNEAVGDTARSP